jgi:hypothetical protein
MRRVSNLIQTMLNSNKDLKSASKIKLWKDKMLISEVASLVWVDFQEWVVQKVKEEMQVEWVIYSVKRTWLS